MFEFTVKIIVEEINFVSLEIKEQEPENEKIFILSRHHESCQSLDMLAPCRLCLFRVRHMPIPSLA